MTAPASTNDIETDSDAFDMSNLQFERPAEKIKTIDVPPIPERIFKGMEKYEDAARGMLLLFIPFERILILLQCKVTTYSESRNRYLCPKLQTRLPRTESTLNTVPPMPRSLKSTVFH
jgi:hypothetical protein